MERLACPPQALGQAGTSPLRQKRYSRKPSFLKLEPFKARVLLLLQGWICGVQIPTTVSLSWCDGWFLLYALRSARKGSPLSVFMGLYVHADRMHINYFPTKNVLNDGLYLEVARRKELLKYLTGTRQKTSSRSTNYFGILILSCFFVYQYLSTSPFRNIIDRTIVATPGSSECNAKKLSLGRGASNRFFAHSRFSSCPLSCGARLSLSVTIDIHGTSNYSERMVRGVTLPDTLPRTGEALYTRQAGIGRLR